VFDDIILGQVQASKFQMIEVRDSYRHSTDPASRGRVRSAINDGIRGLPDWPKKLEEQEREILQLGEQIRSGQVQVPSVNQPNQNQGLFDGSINQGYQSLQPQQQQQWGGFSQPQPSYGIQQQQPQFQQPQPTGFYPTQQQQFGSTGYGGGWGVNQGYGY
jgi:hypothetical protein